MRLFDDYERHELRASGESESQFSYYNLSARPAVVEFRGFLEQWFAAYQDAHKAEFLSRFRSPDNPVHQSAFFELYLFRLLKGMGYNVEVHPPTKSGKHPDFLAFDSNVPAFYLEAALSLPSIQESAAKKRVAQAYDTLNKLESPNFFLYLRVVGSPNSPIPAAKLRNEVGRWLSTLDPEEIALAGPHGGPCLQWHHDGWEIEIEPIAKGPKYRGIPGVRPIGVTFPEMKYLNTPEYIKGTVEAKGGKYTDLRLPLLLAINVINEFCEETDIFEGLIGQEETVVNFGPDGRVTGHSGRRKLNGSWFDKHGPRNTSISAAFVASYLVPWNMGVSTPILIHNPWSKNPLRPALWPLPQYVGSLNEDSFIKQKGAAARCFLGIPEGWPTTFE